MNFEWRHALNWKIILLRILINEFSLAIIAIMIVGMLIGSAIAAGVVTYFGIEESFITRLTLVGYVFSMIVAIVTLTILIWRLWRGKDD